MKVTCAWSVIKKLSKILLIERIDSKSQLEHHKPIRLGECFSLCRSNKFRDILAVINLFVGNPLQALGHA